jgi:hypothetical protein
MVRRVIFLIVIAAGLAAPSSLAQVVLSPSVFHSHDLPANASTAFTVACPSGYLAASAGIANPAPGVTLLSIHPAGFRAYAFRFGNPPENSDQKVTVVVACRKISSSGSKPRIVLRQKLVQSRVIVPAGKLSTAGLACPPSTAPAGRGFDLTLSQPGNLASPISFRKNVLHLHGFSFAVLNKGARARTIVLYGNCLTLVRAAGTRRQQLGIKITTFRDLAQPGSLKFVHRCPSGWVSLAAGYSLGSSLQTVRGAAAIARSGKWSVENAAKVPVRVELQLACGSLQR